MGDQKQHMRTSLINNNNNTNNNSNNNNTYVKKHEAQLTELQSEQYAKQKTLSLCRNS